MFRRRQRNLIETHSRKTVVVHLDDGTSVKGILDDVADDCVVIAHGAVLGAENNVSIDGAALLPIGRVAWLQVLTPEATP